MCICIFIKTFLNNTDTVIYGITIIILIHNCIIYNMYDKTNVDTSTKKKKMKKRQF